MYSSVLNGFESSSESHDRNSISDVDTLREMLLLMFFVTPSTNENSSIYISSNRITGAFLLSENFISNSAFSESTLKAITQSKILSRLLLSIAFRSQFALLSKIDQLTIYASVEQVEEETPTEQ